MESSLRLPRITLSFMGLPYYDPYSATAKHSAVGLADAASRS